MITIEICEVCFSGSSLVSNSISAVFNFFLLRWERVTVHDSVARQSQVSNDVIFVWVVSKSAGRFKGTPPPHPVFQNIPFRFHPPTRRHFRACPPCLVFHFSHRSYLTWLLPLRFFATHYAFSSCVFPLSFIFLLNPASKKPSGQALSKNNYPESR